MLVAVPVGIGIAIFLTEILPAPAAPAHRHRHRTARRHPQHHLRHLGPVRLCALVPGKCPDTGIVDTLANVPYLRDFFGGPPYGIGIFTASLILSIMILPFISAVTRDVFETVPPMLKEAAYGLGCTTWEVMWRVVLPFARSGVVGGAMLALGRALGETMAVTFVIGNAHHIHKVAVRAGHDDLGHHRQRIHRSGRRSLPVIADRDGPDPVLHHLHRAGQRPADAARARTPCGKRVMNSTLYRAPQASATDSSSRCRSWPPLFGLHLARLYSRRRCSTTALPAISRKLFTEMTPPPGEDGGLANAIVGSVMMSMIAVLAGTPIGLFAGTYLAEYGRYTRLAFVVRFVNDILLSAPSIVTGLFIYEIVVVQMGHFSAWAGAASLTVIVIPVVVRTTENMLLLVPNGLREAAAALGAPHSFVIRAVTWRAARAGIVTGVLLAMARISGETAPLLFTALNNQFWSTDLNAPMASLPAVIFQFAMSPYEDWHRLAWAGALLITATVLTLSASSPASRNAKRS